MSRALIVVATADDRQKAARWVEKAPWNTRIEFKAPKRSLPQNDRMWAMLTDVMMHMRQHGKDYTTDQWKAIFMHACGKEVSFLPSLDGKTFIPWGQSSSDLSKTEMTDLIEFVFAWGAENGVTFNEPADGSSAGGQGSSLEIPPSAAAADQSESPSAAAEAGEPEAREEPSAAPASDIIKLKRECLDKFLAAATDPTAPDAKDRQATIIFAKDAWKQSLPTELDFVKKCLETADAVVKGNLSQTMARRYLEGLL